MYISEGGFLENLLKFFVRVVSGNLEYFVVVSGIGNYVIFASFFYRGSFLRNVIFFSGFLGLVGILRVKGEAGSRLK